VNRYCFERRISKVICKEIHECQFVDGENEEEAKLNLREEDWDEVHSEEVKESRPVILAQVQLFPT
jgi:hypothetical protein